MTADRSESRPTIRAARPGDEERILELFHRRFHPDRTLAHWRWKFRDHPRGPGVISVAEDESGDLIAHCGGYPCVLVSPGSSARSTPPLETVGPSPVPPAGLAPSDDGVAAPGWPIRCVQVGDVMADRRALKGGLVGGAFERTLRHLHGQAGARGDAFTFGVAARKIDAFYARTMGRRRVGPVAYRRHDPAALAARLRDTRSDTRGTTVEVVDRPDRDFDELLDRAGPAYGVLTRRDADYVDWRYCRCPDEVHRVHAARRSGRLVGWAAFRRMEDRLVWGDALVDPGHPGAVDTLLLAALRELGGPQEIERIEAWFPRHPAWWNEKLEDLGFELRPEPRGLSLIYICTGPERPDERRILDRLYYTMGDTDLF